MTLRILGFPVTFHVSAWIVAAFAMITTYGRDLGASVAVGLFILLSALLHELGHAFVARAQGLDPVSILLHGFGGWTRHEPCDTPRQQIVLTAAGPLAGLVPGLLVLGFLRIHPGTSPLPEIFGWINVGWSLFNLLPMRPLDGGFLVHAALFLVGLRETAAEAIIRIVSLLTLALVCYAGVVLGRQGILPVSWFFLGWVALMVVQRNVRWG